MASIDSRQPVTQSTECAPLGDASHKEVTFHDASSGRWTSAQILYVWISSTEARKQGSDACRYDLSQLAERSSCGLALYNAVAAKLESIGAASARANAAIQGNKVAEYNAWMTKANSETSAFKKWLARWAIQTGFTKQKHDPNGSSTFIMKTVIVPQDSHVMATLLEYRSRRPSMARSQDSSTGKVDSRRVSVTGTGRKASFVRVPS